MRKKSHISLVGYLIENLKAEPLQKHRKAFYFGSILPDLLPSFLTRRHTIEQTFPILAKEIGRLTETKRMKKGLTTAYCRKLGVITHYVADYFTFPHNSVFHGSLKEHCRYEALLKTRLAEYVRSSRERRETLRAGFFSGPEDGGWKIRTREDILSFIRAMHEEYLTIAEEIKRDIQYIVELCYRVVDAILQILENFRDGETRPLTM